MLTNTKWGQVLILILCILTIHNYFPNDAVGFGYRLGEHITEVN